jgi:hypothetical protein
MQFRRWKMGTLIFVCPATGLKVFTGLEMDVDSFATLPSVLPEVRCPHCSKPHELSELAVWLADGEGRILGDQTAAKYPV